jgi:hypothetical protein
MQHSDETLVNICLENEIKYLEYTLETNVLNSGLRRLAVYI